MKQLLTLSCSLAAVFALTFLVIQATGVLTVDDIKNILAYAATVNVFYLGLAVVILLFLDIFIAVPTLTIVTLSGYFMGPVLGTLFSITGMWLAGLCGYAISRKWGNRLLIKIYKDPKKLHEMKEVFDHYGIYTLVLCRAAPMLPEVTCCLSGVNGVQFRRFFLYYSLGTVPYALIAAFSGSQSTLESPLPGILGPLGISIFLWTSWYFLFRYHFRTKSSTSE